MRPSDFTPLDSVSFRPFYFAAHTLSFTEAARRTGMTQSGVSQHIAKLEETLGTALFLRVKRKVLLTEAGKRLKQHVERCFDEEQALRDVLGKQMSAPQGLVTYAMPASCLMTPHFTMLLAERKRSFPKVELRVTICSTDEVVDRLLAGEADFGFVTRHTGDPAVDFRYFCDEEYVLIAGEKAQLSDLTARTIGERRFLHHPGVEIFFTQWMTWHFPKAKRVPWDSLNVVGGVNSLEGVIKMVEGGVGLTVLPRHCVDSLLSRKTLHAFPGDRTGGAANAIHIVTLAGTKLPRRTQTVLDAFLRFTK